MPKLTLSLLLVILLAVLGLGAVLDNFFNQYQTNPNNESDELSVYRQLGKSLAATLDRQEKPQQFIDSWQQEADISVTLVHLEDFFLPDSLKDTFHDGEPVEFETDENISIHFIVPSHKKVLIFIISPIVEESNHSLLKLLFTAVFYLGILMVVLIWLYPLIKQLRQLRQTTKSFGEGHLHQRININSTSYIASIENEFNGMADQIETLISDNKLLSDAVAHDLRTPLARLRFGIEMLQEADKPETREKYQNRLCRDIDEMEKLINVLLNYARMEQSMMAVERQSINLNELISQCVGAVTDGKKNINWHEQGDAMINGNANYLSMLINNLLGNALQYAKNEITMTVVKSDSTLQFIISDDGPGIAKEKRSELLKPFIRGELYHENSGYGMGLAIVSRIAKLHNATLTISDSAELGGAEFCLTFNR
jgi:signal transduction histidine kinase